MYRLLLFQYDFQIGLVLLVFDQLLTRLLQNRTIIAIRCTTYTKTFLRVLIANFKVIEF